MGEKERFLVRDIPEGGIEEPDVGVAAGEVWAETWEEAEVLAAEAGYNTVDGIFVPGDGE